MTSLVKTVFQVIIGVTVAMLLYLVLFGTYDLNGNSLVGTSTGNISQVAEWKGVLWHMAEAVETPMSRYYYEYCFLPNIHANDYVTEALGGNKDGTKYPGGNIQKTESDLLVNPSSLYSDLYTFSPNYMSIKHYSTGWK